MIAHIHLDPLNVMHRGLPNMFEIIINEIATWPQILQTTFTYTQKATVIIPIMAVLG